MPASRYRRLHRRIHSSSEASLRRTATTRFPSSLLFSQSVTARSRQTSRPRDDDRVLAAAAPTGRRRKTVRVPVPDDDDDDDFDDDFDEDFPPLVAAAAVARGRLDHR